MKGRFAPSPTGRMHLGNVLSAFLSWLSVKSQAGSWVLRIEDLDPGRSRDEFSRMIEDDLQWLGLEWDEGGMDNPEYRQSRRSDIYDHYFEKLKELGMVYPCYCSRADLMAASAPHQSDGRIIYPGTCRPACKDGRIIAAQDTGTMPHGDSEAPHPDMRQTGMQQPETRLTGTAQTDMQRTGRKPAWRIMVPDLSVTINDLHYGPVSANLASDCGDFIIRRADGTAAYQLAVVVDDALMGITEVVRGNDLLLSSPQQAWLHETLGFKAPSFAHLPLLCAADGRRLCKRDKDMDMGEIRRRYTPEQTAGLLAFLSGLRPDCEPVKVKDLIPSFDWNKVPTSNIILEKR